MGDVAAACLSARAAVLQRQDRRDRLLLGRPRSLSRGLHAPGIDAAVDCWGGGVIVDDPSSSDAKRPVAPIDLTADADARCSASSATTTIPTPDQVNRTEAELKRLGKTYEFHRYDGAGHGFFAIDRPAYRPEQAVDAWNKVFAFSAQAPDGVATPPAQA